jgi:hypothetical protein
LKHAEKHTKTNNHSSPNLANESHAPFFQPKLNIGSPGDKYELEADKMADRVTEQSHEENQPFFSPAVSTQVHSAPNLPVQNFPVEDSVLAEIQKQEEEEEIMQMQPSEEEETIQQQPEDEDEQLQMKQAEEEYPADVQALEDEERRPVMAEKEEQVQAKSERAPAVPAGFESDLNGSKGSGSPLPSDIKGQMESGLGADFSNVRVHTDTTAAKMNRQIGAQAFTHGSDIFFNEGKYKPESDSGKHLLAHELTHTVQQGASVSNSQNQKEKSDKAHSSKATLKKNSSHRKETQSLDQTTVASKNSVFSDNSTSPANTIEKSSSRTDSKSSNPAIDPEIVRNKGKTSKTQRKPPPERKRPRAAGKRKSNGNRNLLNRQGKDAVSRTRKASYAPASGILNGGAAGKMKLNAGVEITQLFDQFSATATQLREQVNTSTTTSKQRISQGGESAIEKVQNKILFAKIKLSSRFTKAKGQINQKGVETQAGLFKKGAQSNERHQNLQANISDQINTIAENSDNDVSAQATAQSEKIIAHGNTSGAKAISTSNTNAERALSLGSTYASQHSGDMASEGSSAALRHGSEVAASLRSQGQMLDGATRRDAALMSQDILTNSSDAIGQIQAALTQAGASFLSVAPSFSSGIDQLIQTSLIHTHDLEGNSFEQLDALEVSTMDSLGELELRFANLAALGVSKGHLVIDEASTTRLELIENTERQVFEMLDGVPADPGGEFEDGLIEIQNRLIESLFTVNMDVDQATGRIENELTRGSDSVNSGTDELTLKTEDSTSEIEIHTTDGFDQVLEGSEGIFDQFIEGITDSFNEAVHCISTKASWAVERLIEDLGLAEENGEQQLDERNESAAIEQDNSVGSLAEYLRDELTEFLGGGRFVRFVVSLALLPVAILEYFVGVIAGLIMAVLKFIAGLVVLVLAIIAALFALGFVVGVLFMILYECVGLIPAIILSLIALVVGLLLIVVIAVVAIIVGIGVMVVTILMNIWKAFTDSTLSPFDRGFLIGESIGDIILLLIPFLKGKLKIKLPAWLSRRLAPLIARAKLLSRLLILVRGNLPRLIRLTRLFGNDLAKLERFLVLFRDAALLERVVNGLGGVARLERVLPLVDDIAQLGRLVGLVRNGARLEALLNHAKIRNAAQLEALLGNIKIRNAAQLESLLNNPKITEAAQLEALLGNNKIRNAAELERLLNNTKLTDLGQIQGLLNNPKVRNAGELADLLDNAKIIDLAELERLIGLTDDTGQLKTMLNMVNTAEDLEIYLIMAGGQPNAALLANLLRRAVNMGDYHRIEGILTIASGNASKFEQLGIAVGRFKLQTASAPAPTDLHGYSGININHFLKRHTYEFFDFGDIKANNTFWPEGTDVALRVEEALTILDGLTPPRRILPFENPPVTVTLSSGINTQIGVNNANSVGQFFPFADSSLNVINFVRNEMEAIASLLIP